MTRGFPPDLEHEYSFYINYLIVFGCPRLRAEGDASPKFYLPPECGMENLVFYTRRNKRKPTESAVVDTVEIPILSERQLAKLKTGNRENIAFDELDNAVWQFAPDEEADLETPGGQVHALEHPALSIVEDEPPATQAIRSNAKGLQAGYNPYDSGHLARKFACKPRDMRELSKWIEIRKKLGAGK